MRSPICCASTLNRKNSCHCDVLNATIAGLVVTMAGTSAEITMNEYNFEKSPTPLHGLALVGSRNQLAMEKDLMNELYEAKKALGCP